MLATVVQVTTAVFWKLESLMSKMTYCSTCYSIRISLAIIGGVHHENAWAVRNG